MADGDDILPSGGEWAGRRFVASQLERREQEIDRAWAREAQQRLADLRSGRVCAIPGQQVFEAIRDKFDS